MLKEQPAEDRAERDSRTDGSSPCADRLAPLVRREHHGDDRKRCREDRGPTDPHDGSKADEHPGGIGEGADRRGSTEDAQPDEEDLLAADPVSDHAPGEEQRGEREDVRVDGPDQFTLGGIEIMLDRWKSDVQDRVVKDNDEQAHDEDPEDRPASWMPLARCHPACVIHACPSSRKCQR